MIFSSLFLCKAIMAFCFSNHIWLQTTKGRIEIKGMTEMMSQPWNTAHIWQSNRDFTRERKKWSKVTILRKRGRKSETRGYTKSDPFTLCRAPLCSSLNGWVPGRLCHSVGVCGGFFFCCLSCPRDSSLMCFCSITSSVHPSFIPSSCSPLPTQTFSLSSFPSSTSVLCCFIDIRIHGSKK